MSDDNLCIPLRDHLLALREADAQFREERDRRYEEMDLAREKATLAALNDLREWKATANEWRQAMVDREAKFTPLALHDMVMDRVVMAEKKMEARSNESVGMSRGWAYVIAAVSLLAALVSTIIAIAAVFKDIK